MYCVCVVVPVVKCLRFAFLLYLYRVATIKLKYALRLVWMLFLVTKTKEVKGWVDKYKLQGQ